MFIDDVNFQWVPFNKDHYRAQLVHKFTNGKGRIATSNATGGGVPDRAQIVFNKDKPNQV